MEILLSEEDRKGLSDRFVQRLQEILKEGVEIRVHPAVKGGFRVGTVGGEMYYDFTDQGIAELLALIGFLFNFIPNVRTPIPKALAVLARCPLHRANVRSISLRSMSSRRLPSGPASQPTAP